MKLREKTQIFQNISTRSSLIAYYYDYYHFYYANTKHTHTTKKRNLNQKIKSNNVIVLI